MIYIGIIFGIVIGILLARIFPRLTENKYLTDQEVIDAVAPDYWRFTHVKPKCASYRDGYWQNITICTNCFRTARHEDQHIRSACPSCGSKVVEGTGVGPNAKRFSGIWLPAMGKWEVSDVAEKFYPPIEL